MSKYLYTYVPKDNTVAKDGLLSTRLAPHGWEKYVGRTGKDTKDEVLEALDGWDPGFRRSNAISFFPEPIGEDADSRMREFAEAKALYRVDAAKLIALGILKQFRSVNIGRRGTHPVGTIPGRHIDWAQKKPGKKFLFINVPHYLAETANGSIPPEYVEEVKG